MCGRYTLTNSAAVREEMERITGVSFEEFAPRFNAAPSQTMPVVATDEDGAYRIALMRWGLVPFWEKSDKPKFAPINARSEEILGKPMFRQSVQKRRCLVPADGFFEWKRLDEKTKIPHFISLALRDVFFIAGIYEAATESRPETYALLTTGPNELMREIHDRMPVILTRSKARQWIWPGTVSPDDVARLSVPLPASEMRAYPVSSIVNNPRNDAPVCVEPLE